METVHESLTSRLAQLGGASELAEIAGVSSSTAYRWLTGKSKPYRKTLVTIANAMQVRPMWLIRGEGQMYDAPAVDFPDNPVQEPPTTAASEHPPGTLMVIRNPGGYVRVRVVLEQVGEPVYSDSLPVSEEAVSE